MIFRLIILIVLPIANILFSDTVYLKENAKFYENVKAKIDKKSVEITTKEGKTLVISRQKISNMKIEPVEWDIDSSHSHDEMLRVYQETINYSTFLQEESNSLNKDLEKTREKDLVAMNERVEALEERAYRQKTTHWKSAGKSLLIPGWGQYSDDHKQKGLAIFGTFVLANAAASLAKHYHTTKLNSFNSELIYPYTLATVEGGSIGWTSYFYFKDQNDQLDLRMSRYNQVQRVVVGVWAFAILDALFYTDPNPPEPKAIPSTSWNLDFSLEPVRVHSTSQWEQKTNLQFSWSF
jgi:hypothetical protein